MTVLEFKSSIVCESIPPAFSSPEARSLWYAKKGEWEKSHEIAQSITTPVGSWIHAMLHLMEGDIKNARYWKPANRSYNHRRLMHCGTKSWPMY